jgi:hypothetical protein
MKKSVMNEPMPATPTDDITEKLKSWNEGDKEKKIMLFLISFMSNFDSGRVAFRRINVASILFKPLRWSMRLTSNSLIKKRLNGKAAVGFLVSPRR